MMSVLLKSGLPLLLRYSLDDSSDVLQAASLQCLHSLLVSPADESFVEDYSDSFAGLLLPSLSPSCDVEEKEDEEVSDEKMVEQDIVKVCVNTVIHNSSTIHFSSGIATDEYLA